MQVKIAGLGWYLPERRVPNSELEEQLHIPAGWIERVTGVYERRYVTDETAVGMGGVASRLALADAGLEVGDIDAIIGASAAPQQMIPCSAALMQRELGAPDGESACFDINATCLGFLVTLQHASHLIAAGVYRNVLIFSSEIGSRSLNPKERESAVLFGDAAAAAVLTRSVPGDASAVWHSQFTTYSSGADFTQIQGGGNLHHPNDPATTPEMNMFHMRGPSIFKLGMRVIGPFVDRFFAALEMDRRELDAVVPHQASRHAVELLHKHLGFEERQVISNLAERGNCISASIPLALAEAVQAGRIKRGDRILLIGSGAGLTLGAVALTF